MPLPLSAGTIIADLIQIALDTAMRYNAERRKAEAEGRTLSMADVKRVQAELKDNQSRLDAKIAAMPED